MASHVLLAFEAVSVAFRKRGPRGSLTTALDGLSFAVAPGRSLGVIGDSGAGKSTLCRAAAGLVRPRSGRILLDGADLSAASRREWQRARRHLGVVFQDAPGSFNPLRPVADALATPLVSYTAPTKAELRRAVGEVMERVGLAPAQMTRYPHEFSGGQIQRLAIARALITKPRLLILDEPVSALDVSIRAQILNLLADLAATLALTCLVISSDPAVVRYLTADTLVLYAGRVVEAAPTARLFSAPLHPYTVSLLALRDPAVALREPGLSGARAAQAPQQGTAAGCPFAGICPRELTCCREVAPELVPLGAAHEARCHSLAAAPAGRIREDATGGPTP